MNLAVFMDMLFMLAALVPAQNPELPLNGSTRAQVPVGTQITAELQKPIKANMKVGERVQLVATQYTYAAGAIVVPKGALLMGTITLAEKYSRETKESRLAFQIDRASFKGQEVPLRAVPISFSWPLQARSLGKKDLCIYPTGEHIPCRTASGPLSTAATMPPPKQDVRLKVLKHQSIFISGQRDIVIPDKTACVLVQTEE